MSVWVIVTVVIKAPALTSWLQNSQENSASVIQAGLGNAAAEVNIIMPQTHTINFIHTHQHCFLLQQVPSLMLVLIQLSTPSEDSWMKDWFFMLESLE